MSTESIRLAVALLVGRDLAVPSACCPTGEICRAEIRQGVGSSYAQPTMFGGDHVVWKSEMRMFQRLKNCGLEERDYARVLALPRP